MSLGRFDETAEVQRQTGEGAGETENRHAPQAGSDVEAALDELTAVCPNLESVAVVVSSTAGTPRAMVSSSTVRGSSSRLPYSSRSCVIR